MHQDMSLIYAERFYALLESLKSASFEPMPNMDGGIYFGRPEPPTCHGGYRLAWVSSVLAEPECGVEDLEVAGWTVEVSDGTSWRQHGNRKMYETRGVAVHSVEQIRRLSPGSWSFRVVPVYRLGLTSARNYNIYRVLGGAFGEVENENDV